MARRKRRSTRNRTNRRRGRRVGAVSFKGKVTENDLMFAGGVLIGSVSKKFIDTFLSKQETLKIKQETIDWIQVLAGGAGYIYLDGALYKGMSLGLGTTALISGMQGMGVLKGVGLPPMVPFQPRPKRLNGGASITQTVGGTNIYGFPKTPGVGNPYRMRRTSKRFMSM